jgi:hypothetical protein
MQTFESVVIDVYLPAYRDLYDQIKVGTKKFQAQQTLYFVAKNIKAHDNFICNQNIIEKCNAILNSMSTKGLRRREIDRLLLNLLYALRKELRYFCVEYYPLVNTFDYKLENHYTWNYKINLEL